MEDLAGAFNFLESFGKEIKPRRYYLAGKSLGGVVALAFASDPAYAKAVRGVATLGLILHDSDRQHHYYRKGLPGLQASLLVVQGERDPYAGPDAIRAFLENQPFSGRLEIIEGSGHSYQPVPAPTEPEKIARTEANTRRVIEVVLGWLEEQDSVRDNFRI